MQNSHTWYLVANSQNALIFREEEHKLEPVADITPKTLPATGSRSTRGHHPGGEGSIYYTSDPQDRLNGHDEKIFIADVAEWLSHASDDSLFDKLVIAAAPATLGYIRDELDHRVKAKVTEEMDKDYTNLPILELEAALLKRN